MKALILAGGFGTRLKDVVNDVPKPMALILGKPFLEHQIRFLKDQGITEIILAVHHMSDKIKSYFGNGLRLGVDIVYSEEDSPLGTAGAIKKAQKYLEDTFLVINGDSYCPVNIKDLIAFHKTKKSNFTMCLVKHSDGPNYGNVILSNDNVIDFIEKGDIQGTINAGIYVFEPKIFDLIESEKNLSLEKDIFPKLSKESMLFGYLYEGYFIDIGRPETYNKFRKEALSSLFIGPELKIKNAMEKMNKVASDILFVVDNQRKLLGVLTEKMITRFILKDGNLENFVDAVMARDPITARVNDDKSKIQEMLLSGVHRLPILDETGILIDVEFHSEKIKTENFPIVRGRSPLRISFAGGGTDLPYFFEKYGGAVMSATIDKYCHASIIKRADSKIMINSDLGEDIVLDPRKDMTYNGKFDLIKAIVNIMKPDFGFEIYLYNDIPPGRGLGSSATMTVLIVSLLSHLMEKNFDDYKIADIAYRVERDELKIKGGWQDQYAAVIGGFNFMEFNSDNTIIYPLRIKPELIHEFNEHLMLCYVGGSHFSGDLHKDQEKNFLDREEEMVKNLNDLKYLAIKIKDSLLTNNLENIGKILHESWENKKKLNHGITNINVDRLYEVGIKNGAYGGRLLGAGGGGYILFFHSPKKRNQLKKALENEGGEIINFNFEFGGTIIKTVKGNN